jgi:hypothetical protein
MRNPVQNSASYEYCSVAEKRQSLEHMKQTAASTNEEAVNGSIQAPGAGLPREAHPASSAFSDSG